VVLDLVNPLCDVGEGVVWSFFRETVKSGIKLFSLCNSCRFCCYSMHVSSIFTNGYQLALLHVHILGCIKYFVFRNLHFNLFKTGLSGS